MQLQTSPGGITKTITPTTFKALFLAFAPLGSGSLIATAADTRIPPRDALVKARGVTLPEFKVDGVSLDEAVGDLQAASRSHDVTRKGVNFIVFETARARAGLKMTLDLKHVTVAEAAERLAQRAGFRLTAEEFALVVQPKTDQP